MRVATGALKPEAASLPELGAAARGARRAPTIMLRQTAIEIDRLTGHADRCRSCRTARSVTPFHFETASKHRLSH